MLPTKMTEQKGDENPHHPYSEAANQPYCKRQWGVKSSVVKEHWRTDGR